MTIVGHKIERYLTGEQRGGLWLVIHHQVITALHATKGWRPHSYDRKLHEVKELPTIDQWRAADITVFVRNPDLPPKVRPEYGFQFATEARREASLMRHGWYRRRLARLEATGIQP